MDNRALWKTLERDSECLLETNYSNLSRYHIMKISIKLRYFYGIIGNKLVFNLLANDKKCCILSGPSS